MMEPSEQCAYNNDHNPPEDLPSEEERVIVESPEDLALRQEESEQGPQVYGFLEVQDSEDGALGIEVNGQHFVFQPGSVDGEFYVLVPEGQVVTLDSAIKPDEASEEDSLPAEDVPHNVEGQESDKTEQDTVAHENSDNNQIENVKYLTIREVSNGVAYIPTPTDSFSHTVASTEEGNKNEKLLNLAAVAQEIESADAHSGTTEHIPDLESHSLTEGSVIVSQIHTDADSVSNYPASETDEDTATDLASEHDNSKSGFGETSTDLNMEAEPDTMERRTSFSCISSTRTLDNTVSVIHTTSSTYIHDELGKGAENSFVSNDYEVKPKLDTTMIESEHSEDSVPDLHVNLSQDTCSNQNDKFSNQDEDSVLSQNCGLDLTKESNIVSHPCDEDSLPVVEHTRSRYGIMDALNKDKQISYYDTNTSEEMEDTINSSSRSTNITEDGESVGENNSNELESNNIKEVTSENDPTPEKLSTENENSNLKQDAKVIETSEKNSPGSFQDSNAVKETNNPNEGLLSERRLRSFCLPPNEDSNSAFSDHVPSPSLATKELSSSKSQITPTQKRKKTMDAYDFNDTSTENDCNSQNALNSQQLEVFEEGRSPKVPCTEISHDKEESTKKLTFHEAFVREVLVKEDDISKNKHNIEFDGSAPLFDDTPEMDQSQEETLSNHEDFIPEQETVPSENNNATPESLVTERAFDQPCSSKMSDVLDLMDTEESLVKTPQKTYIKRKRKLIQGKIELFSCEDLSIAKDNETPPNNDTQNKAGSILCPYDDLSVLDEDLESKVKVYATYNRKRKSVPAVVQINRARSLRPRSMQADELLENGAVDTSICDLEGRLSSQEKVDSEDANWGAILLGTQFSSQPSSTEQPPTPSTSSPNNSQPSRERKKPAWFTTPNSRKSQLASGKQFDKLIKSSPTKVKGDSATDKKKLIDRIKKQAMSLCNNLSPVSARIKLKRGRPKGKVTSASKLKVPLASISKNTKMSAIKFVPQVCVTSYDANNVEENISFSDDRDGRINLEKKFTCTQCSYCTTRLNNLLWHMKYCCTYLEHGYNHKEVPDPNKLQLLRGDGAGCIDSRDGKNKKNAEMGLDHWNGSAMDSRDQPCCSTSLENKNSDKDKDDAALAKEKFGFANKDVVWVKRGRWHWPAVVWKIGDKVSLFYVISSPNHCEALKIASNSLNRVVHSFDDVTWAKKLLEEAKRMPNNSSFFKAVQKADSYARKKVLDDANFDAKTYFNIDTKDEDIEKKRVRKKPFLEEAEPDTTTVNMDIEKVMNCIWQGNCNHHVVSLYYKSIPSQRHELFEKDKFAKELEDMSWFGPFKTDSSMQLRLYDHFYDLYKKEIDGPPNISYIYKVWIPEGIIKAISLVNKISFCEAEIIFLKQDTYDDIISL